MRRFMPLLLLLFFTNSLFAQEVTPESTEIPEESPPLRAFTLEVSEVSGVAPADWNEIQAGSYVREDGTTYILHVAAEGVSLDDLLEPFLEAYELDALPENEETYEASLFTWELYHFDFSPDENANFLVSFAIAQTEEMIFLVIFQTTPDEYPALKEDILLTSLDYFGMPLELIQAELGIEPLETTVLLSFGLETAYPASWQSGQEGSFVRNPPNDVTTLIVQSSADLDAISFAELLLTRLGLPAELPEDGEIYGTDYLAWTVYRISLSEGQFQLSFAIAEDESQAYLVVMLCTADEAELLEDTVLFPVLAATKPIE